jgi:hypothetical protein
MKTIASAFIGLMKTLFLFDRCVITELFTDGHPPFDLSQLLGYRCGEYSPWKIVEKIEDVNVKVGAQLLNCQSSTLC